MEIDWCAQTAIPDLQEFLARHGSANHILVRAGAFLAWQFRHPLDADLLYILVARHQGSIVGMLGLIDAPFNDCGQRRSGVMLANWLVANTPQARGVGLQLLNYVLAGPYDFIGTVGCNPTAQRLYAGLRFTVCARLSRWICPVSLPQMQSLLTAAGVDRVPQAIAPPPPEAHDCTVHSWDSAAAAPWNAAWELLAPTMRGVWKDAAYLHDRYIHHPSLHYNLLIARNTVEEVVGVAVYRIIAVQDRPEKVLRVLELLARTPEAATSLAAEIRRQADVHQVAFADFYCTEPAAAAGLLQAGFQSDDTLGEWPSLFNPLDARCAPVAAAFRAPNAPDHSAFWQSAPMYFTRGDCDQDRPN